MGIYYTSLPKKNALSVQASNAFKSLGKGLIKKHESIAAIYYIGSNRVQNGKV